MELQYIAVRRAQVVCNLRAQLWHLVCGAFCEFVGPLPAGPGAAGSPAAAD
jgi:hypothetical protein